MEDIKSLVTRFYDTWNAHDRDGWLACCDENITFNAPGGIAGQGLDTGRMFPYYSNSRSNREYSVMFFIHVKIQIPSLEHTQTM